MTEHKKQGHMVKRIHIKTRAHGEILTKQYNHEVFMKFLPNEI